MSEPFVESFVDKLILLEQKTGANVQYRVMPPLATPYCDHLSIQKIAREIASFIGLNDYTFIVAVAKQKEGVGGHIDLSTQGTSVHIGIDPGLMKFPDSVGATLCHELCHKWLQSNGIQLALKDENEILTDIASIFLGFGKIMLNGCKVEYVRNETTPAGKRSVTETSTAGYLDRDQLAFVYNFVCAMRKISPGDSLQGLNSEAQGAVQRCNGAYRRYYASYFHQPGESQESIDSFKIELIQAQHIMADLDKHLAYVKASFFETIHSFLKGGHKKIESLRQNVVASANRSSVDPALFFLQAVKTKCEISRLTEQVHSLGQEADGFLSHAKKIGRHLSRNAQRFPPPSPAMFNIVICPQDGTKLRLPENSNDLIATCPICNYSFAYNTGVISFTEASSPTGQSATQNSRWWHKLWKPRGQKRTN